MELTTVTLRVPPDRVADVHAFAAALSGHAQPAPAPVAGELDEDAVRRAYLGGRSTAWRPFLQVLADHSDEWVTWRFLCRAIGRSPSQAGGMLGAAEKRCRQRLPYEKTGATESDRRFRMPERSAAVVRALAHPAP